MGLKSARRTKIVATIGPPSRSEEMLEKLMNAGLNVARINFSHGSHEDHGETCKRIRSVADRIGVNIGVIADLQGPKIRTGKLVDGSPVHLVPGEEVCLTTRDLIGDVRTISTTYQDLPNDVDAGDNIYLADGTLQFIVERVDDCDVHCRVIHGGYLGEHKGINLPGVNVSAASLTEKDVDDLAFILENDFDFIALSFVRSAEDITDLRARIAAAGKAVGIIAKIERPEAVANFDEIVEATDAIMLARGDLGVEVPLNKVPQIQKSLIHKCNDLGVPVITATQMLESMISSVRPTRAEVNDVANAVYDGTDALMLSGETASGEFPVEAVEVMALIASETDAALASKPTHDRIVRMRQSSIRTGRGSFGDAIGQAACRTADAVGATQIVCFSKLGYTAALVARYRPSAAITAITLNEDARRRCALMWGVDAILSVEPVHTDDLDALVDEVLLTNNLAEEGDTVVIAGGFPLAMRTRTNMVKLHMVGER